MAYATAIENNQLKEMNAVRVIHQLNLADSRNSMLHDLGLKPSSKRMRTMMGIKNAVGADEDIYLLKLPGKFFVAISISEIKPATAVAVKIFEYDSNRISAIEHAQEAAIHYRDIITEVLMRKAVARHARGSSYST